MIGLCDPTGVFKILRTARSQTRIIRVSRGAIRVRLPAGAERRRRPGASTRSRTNGEGESRRCEGRLEPDRTPDSVDLISPRTDAEASVAWKFCISERQARRFIVRTQQSGNHDPFPMTSESISAGSPHLALFWEQRIRLNGRFVGCVESSRHTERWVWCAPKTRPILPRCGDPPVSNEPGARPEFCTFLVTNDPT